MIDDYHQQAAKGVLSETAAKTVALAAVETLRYDEGGYFWINDMEVSFLAQQLAVGNLLVKVSPRSDRDELMHALRDMVLRLREVVQRV